MDKVGSKIYLLIILVMMAYIFFLRECSNSDCPDVNVVYSDTNIITSTYIDTIPFYDTIIHTITGTVTSIVYDTVNTDSKIYTLDVSDSLIDGEIVASVRGSLNDAKLLYTPKFPKYIHRTDTIWQTINNQIAMEARNEVYLGPGLLGSRDIMSLGGVISLRTKKENVYAYGIYRDFVSGQTIHSFHTQWKLSLRRNK